jgi:hypothetical protein
VPHPSQMLMARYGLERRDNPAGLGGEQGRLRMRVPGMPNTPFDQDQKAEEAGASRPRRPRKASATTRHDGSHRDAGAKSRRR